MHIAVPRHALSVGVLGEGSEAQAEVLMRLVGEPLIAQVDHLVAKQRVANFRKLRVRHFGGLHAADFGPHGSCQRTHLNMLVRGRVVVEFSVGWSRTRAPYGVVCTALYKVNNISQVLTSPFHKAAPSSAFDVVRGRPHDL